MAARFTAAATRRALGEICARAGLDDADAVLVKRTVNAVYRLPRAGAIVRITGSAAMAHRVAKVVRVARWLAERDVPAVRLMPGVAAPVEAAGRVATVWVDATPLGGPATNPLPHTGDLAGLLRVLHGLGPPHPPLPPWDPLDDVRRRLSDAEALPADDHRFLEDLAERVGTALGAVRYALPPTLIHGDAHLGNLIRTADQGVLLCDFDATCLGPAEWDLVPVAVGHLRFGRDPRSHRELADQYGFDVTAWAGFPVLRAVRELKLVTSVLPVLGSSATVAAQFRVRLDSLRRGDDAARWSLYR
ncbi:Phosphotransferase family protein [Frankia canadensis]|uniref:Phosphotransferase family protein n=1 Tax=Frankia canadensis TaxID=1836972 RepID=A0A2I2L0M3_9ACTN|nr:aminoglycoside phosphotransferase family protein [Frankia canadensis]SNQ51449.1 Phosphotransferase family protein [Frankia canadensis]SOU58739.1 Phosphotransferase family protein [Frankia canadensis]